MVVAAGRVGAGHGVGAPGSVEFAISAVGAVGAIDAIDAIGTIGTFLVHRSVLELLGEVVDAIEETH